MDVARVGGAVVMEGIRGLSGDGGGDVGLLAPMTSISLSYHVLLGLEEKVEEDILNWCSRKAWQLTFL